MGTSDKDVIRLQKKLSTLNPHEDNEMAKRILKVLMNLKPSSKLIQKTQMRTTVNRMRKSSTWNEDTRSLASKLVKTWESAFER